MPRPAVASKKGNPQQDATPKAAANPAAVARRPILGSIRQRCHDNLLATVPSGPPACSDYGREPFRKGVPGETRLLPRLIGCKFHLEVSLWLGQTDAGMPLIDPHEADFCAMRNVDSVIRIPFRGLCCDEQRSLERH